MISRFVLAAAPSVDDPPAAGVVAPPAQPARSDLRELYRSLALNIDLQPSQAGVGPIAM